MKNKVFIGTYAIVAKTALSAKSKFNKATQHIVEEDGNPYDSMLDWEVSDNWDICPKCGNPNHKTNGHYCPVLCSHTVIKNDIGNA